MEVAVVVAIKGSRDYSGDPQGVEQEKVWVWNRDSKDQGRVAFTQKKSTMVQNLVGTGDQKLIRTQMFVFLNLPDSGTIKSLHHDDGIARQTTVVVVVTKQARNASESVDTPLFIVILNIHIIFS